MSTMPTLRFRLCRQGYSALTTDHRASSPEELAAALSLAPEPGYWPATLCVFRCTVPPGSDLPGWWCPLLERVPLLGRETLRALCQEVWPRAVELGHDYDKKE